MTNIRVTKGRFFEPQLSCPRNGRLEVNQIRNYPVANKPLGAIWTSTFKPDGKYCSDWIKWCTTDAPEWLPKSEDQCYILIPEDNCKIVDINSVSDYLNVLDEYRLHSKYGDVINFEKLSKDYDAIHVTQNAINETAYIDTLYNTIGLWGWSVESTAWFRMCFKKIIKLSSIKHNCKIS